jgi:hypothetical protein
LDVPNSSSTLHVPCGNRYSGILLGESYISIHALADLFLFTFKIPNSEDLTVVESGLLREMSYRQRENLIGEFSVVGDGVLAAVDVDDIIRSAPHE